MEVFLINGTNIQNNTALGIGGGGIQAVNHADVHFKSGTISENKTADTYGVGGGIYLDCSTLDMTGGSIIDNKANQGDGGAGGGIYADCYIADQTTANITGGNISNNSYYGVVYHSGYSKLTYNSGIITGNNPQNIFVW